MEKGEEEEEEEEEEKNEKSRSSKKKNKNKNRREKELLFLRSLTYYSITPLFYPTSTEKISVEKQMVR